MKKTLTAIILLLASATASPGQNPVLVQSAVAPHYPPLAIITRVSGEVLVLVKIDADGGVALAKAQSGPILLLAAAQNAAKQWRFEPDTGGEREIQLSFKFVLLAEAENAEYDVKFFPPYQVAVEMHPVKPHVSDGTSPND
jgi:TonB family protein